MMDIKVYGFLKSVIFKGSAPHCRIHIMTLIGKECYLFINQIALRTHLHSPHMI